MITAIIQARMNSYRLPGKVLKKVEGMTFLEHMIRRVKRANLLDKIIVATTDKSEDDAIAKISEKSHIEVFRGSENDVLDRYYQTACKFSAEHIVRLTGDCPLMDPEIVDRVIGFYLENPGKYDYVSNINPPTYPWGMDVEIFSFNALEKSQKDSQDPLDKEHVTSYIRQHGDVFRKENIFYVPNFSFLRLTLDYPEDLSVITRIFQELYPRNKNFNLGDILNLYGRKPEIFSANIHIKRNNV